MRLAPLLSVLPATAVAGIGCVIAFTAAFLTEGDPVFPLFATFVVMGNLYMRAQRRFQEFRLRRELSHVHRVDLRHRPFVATHAKNPDTKFCREFDAAFVEGDAETLRFYADRLPFTLPKSLIRKIRYRRFPLVTSPRAEIEWQSPEGPQILVLTPRGVKSPWHANALLDSIRLTLEFRRSELPPPVKYLPPTAL